jgi:hypothetical protein
MSEKGLVMTRRYGASAIALPKIERLLLPDERILWIGKPQLLRMLKRPSERIEPLTMLVIGLLTVFTVAVMLFYGEGRSPLLLSGLLVMLLLTAVLVPTIGQYLIARNTIYAVTTHRAMILEGRTVNSFGAADINCIECRNLNHRRGDVIFKQNIRERLIPNGFMPYPISVFEEIGFFGIEHPSGSRADVTPCFTKQSNLVLAGYGQF